MTENEYESIEWARTDQISPHPSLERSTMIPVVRDHLSANHHGDEGRRARAEALDEDWSAWVAEIEKNGVREPIRVVARDDGGYYAVDGRHRLAAAQELGIIAVKVIVVDESEIGEIAASSVIGRKHWTKSQRAWFAAILHPELVAEARAREKSGQPSALSAEGIANRFGVSTRLIEMAMQLYRFLDEHPEFRERVEPSLWGGAGLGDLLNGVKALVSGHSSPGQPRKLAHAPIKLGQAWASEAAKAANWDDATEEHRIILRGNLERMARDLPESYLKWKLEILSEIAADKGISWSTISSMR